MEQKFVRIFHNNVKTSVRNSIFDDKQNNIFEVPFSAELRKYLQERNIYINTYDMPIKSKPYRNIHFDMPYPTPSNFTIWKNIVVERNKNILICTEPPTVNPFNYMKVFHAFFLKVFTWNDDLVDNKKYKKILLHRANRGINTKSVQFRDKKFLVLINKNILPFFPFKLLRPFGKELYSERIKAIEFFEEKIPNDFHLYGWGWNKPKKYNLSEKVFGFKKYASYKGEIVNKITLLSKYKYCICFENLTDVKGFITEKIFDCFKARCVPIYWGATNIEKYIPKECFIDFRKFRNYDDLLIFLSSIDEDRYNGFIKNIEQLLRDKKFIDTWFGEAYSRFFLEDVLEIKKQ